MIFETLIIYITTLCIVVVVWGYAAIRVLKDGIGILHVKDRVTPPSLISDFRWGTHSFIYLKERGIKLHYIEKGDSSNPLMLFLHGFPECWLSWRHQIEEFSSRFRVVAVDLRGYGDSDKPKKRSDYTIKKISEDIEHLIIALGAEQGGQKCTVVGHDWGGVIAWRLMEDHPELFKRHISINAPHQGVKNQVLRSSFVQYKKAWYVFLFQFPFLPELLLRLNDFELFQKFLRGPKNKEEFFPNDVMETYKYYWSHGGLKYPIFYYNTAFTESVDISEEKIDVPTLIIWGKEDEALSDEIPKRMTKLCSDIQLKWVEGGGHFIHEEEPAYVNQLIRDYIRITY